MDCARGVTWVNFCWVCAAGLSETLPHYSLFCIDPIKDNLGKCNFRDPNVVTLFMHLLYKAF